MNLRFAVFFLAGMVALSVSATAEYKLTVLHINDLHSRLLPVNKYDSTCDADERAEDACFGGFARVAHALNARRDAIEGAGGNVLVLDAGDQFQGSLFYTHYKGAAAAELMNMTGFDAMAIGNHEFDDGPETLLRFLNHVRFPVVSANTVAEPGSILYQAYPTHAVFNKGGEDIAVIGAVAEDTDETSSPGRLISFEDAANVVQPLVDRLTADGIDKIILLSHLGLPRDRAVIRRLRGVDLVVGGHSHTLLSNSDTRAEGPYPLVQADAAGHDVPIVQAYAYSKYMGEITLTFDSHGRVMGFNGDTDLLDPADPKDPALVEWIDKLNAPLEELRQRPVGVAKKGIDGDRRSCRTGECAMGTLVTDAMLWKVKQTGGIADVALQNGGGLRASIDEGPITMGEVLTVLPFQNTLATFKITGADLKAALENGLSRAEEGAGRFPQVSGMRFKWDPAAEPGRRLTEVLIGGKDAEGLQPLNPDRVYRVVTNSYMRTGGDGYAVLRDKAFEAYDYGPGLERALADYLKAHSPVVPQVKGRILTE